MKKVILTGFQPFGPYKFNPVEESTKYFDKKLLKGNKIKGIVLPCTYFGAFKILKEAVEELNPDHILSTGLASSVRGIRFETTGINRMEGKYPDAEGYSPKGIPLIPGGKESIKTNSDNLYLSQILSNNGIKTEISNNADYFICNSLIYLTSNFLQNNKPEIMNTFIHVPWTENYKSKIKLEPHKVMIPKRELQDSIETIIQNVF